MRRRTAILAPALALALAACGGGDATGPGSLPAPLVGGWEAGASCKARGCTIDARIDGSGTSLPLTDSLHLVLDIRETGGVVSTLTFASGQTSTVQGTGRAHGDTLIVDYPGTPSDTIAWTAQGALLRFDFRNTLQLPDVTGDGLPDRLHITVLLARR